MSTETKSFLVTIEREHNEVGADRIHSCVVSCGTALSDRCEVTVTEITEPDEFKVGDRVSIQGGTDGEIVSCSSPPRKFDVRSDDGSLIASAIEGCWLTKLPPKATEPEPDKLKVGDRVTTPGGYDSVVGKITSEYRLDYADGSSATWTRDQLAKLPPKPEITETEPDELKVGDRVTTTDRCDAVVAKIIPMYQVDYPNGSHGSVLWPRNELTKLPPKPTYTVDVKADTLRLLKDGTVSARVPMSELAEVALAITSWPDVYGIDPDEIRNLIDKPREIGRCKANLVTFMATRFAKGWQVTSCCEILSECIAKAMFPIKGPYLTDKQ